MKAKAGPAESWKLFFTLQASLIVFGGGFVTLLIWRGFPSGLHQTSFGRALLFGMFLTFGCSLIAVMNRLILQSNRGLAFPFIFAWMMRPKNVSEPVSDVLLGQAFSLLILGLMCALFAILQRNIDRRKSNLSVSPLADPELDGHIS